MRFDLIPKKKKKPYYNPMVDFMQDLMALLPPKVLARSRFVLLLTSES